MARLIRPIRRTLLLYPPKSLIQQNPICSSYNEIERSPICPSQPQQIITRNYISDIRKSAFQEKITRMLRNEIRYELERSPPKPPVTEYGSFNIINRPGEQWISLKRKFAKNEEIKVEATMFDGAIPPPKPEGVSTNDDMQLHITLIVTISKGDDDVLEIECSAWPDNIEIRKVFVRQSSKLPDEPYVGPEFEDLDDELQDSLYEFLETRGIDDDMAIFLHDYMRNKDRAELIRWLGTAKSYIEEKEKR